MKILAVLAVFLSLPAFADNLVCKSIGGSNAYGRYTVRVKEVSKLKNSGKYDAVYKTTVSVTQSINGVAGPVNVTVVKGNATAYSEDVVYRVISRDLGISMIHFMDEMDQARITLYRAGRAKLELKLSCQYEKPQA